MAVGIRHFSVTQVSVSYKFAPVHCVIFNPEVEHECLQTLCTSKADAPLNSSVVLVVSHTIIKHILTAYRAF